LAAVVLVRLTVRQAQMEATACLARLPQQVAAEVVRRTMRLVTLAVRVAVVAQ